MPSLLGETKMSAIPSIMAKLQASAPATPKARDDLNWETMDVTTLDKPMQDAFAQLLRAQEAERASRKALVELINAKLDLPAHLTVRIGAKWGKLSVAIDKAQRASTAGKAAMSMSDLIAKAERFA